MENSYATGAQKRMTDAGNRIMIIERNKKNVGVGITKKNIKIFVKEIIHLL